MKLYILKPKTKLYFIYDPKIREYIGYYRVRKRVYIGKKRGKKDIDIL